MGRSTYKSRDGKVHPIDNPYKSADLDTATVPCILCSCLFITIWFAPVAVLLRFMRTHYFLSDSVADSLLSLVAAIGLIAVFAVLGFFFARRLLRKTCSKQAREAAEERGLGRLQRAFDWWMRHQFAFILLLIFFGAMVKESFVISAAEEYLSAILDSDSLGFAAWWVLRCLSWFLVGFGICATTSLFMKRQDG